MTLFELEDDKEDIIPGTLWLFEKRDNSTGQSGWYHGNTPPQVVAQSLLRYTKPGDVVIAPFFGSGTTGFEALRRGRYVVGVELKEYLANAVRLQLNDTYPDKQDRFEIVVGDSQSETSVRIAQSILEKWNRQCSLLFLHPPYHDIIRFSDDPRCLSNQGSLEAFLDAFENVLHLWTPLVKPNGGVAIVMGDIMHRGCPELTPLGFLVMERARRHPKLYLRQIAIKNIRDNAGKRQRLGLWKYLAIENNVAVFEHEYVFLLTKNE